MGPTVTGAGGGGDKGVFYSYAYPEPDGFRGQPVAPDAATFDEELGELVLPYAAVRRAADPEADVLSFARSTYETAADLAGWDREHLEAPAGRRRR